MSADLHGSLRDQVRLRVMRLLVEHPDLSQRQIAERLGVSVGGVNYCLKALTEKGWVKVERFSKNPNKLRYAYLITPKGLAAKARLTARFLKQRIAEYELLKEEIEELERELCPSVE